MPNLKVDENGAVVVNDGRPVYVHEDGKEEAYDLPGLLETARKIRGERDAASREREELKSRLSQFDGVDLEEYSTAVEKLRALDEKKLVDAGKVDEVVNERLQKATEKWGQEKQALSEQLAERDARIHKLLVSDRFATSKFVTEKMILPADIAERTFGEHFRVEDGKVVAYIGDSRVYRSDDPSKEADFEDAMQQIVDAYPHKDRILRGTGNSGSSASTNGGSVPSGVKRSQMNHLQKAEYIKQHGQEAYVNLPQ